MNDRSAKNSWICSVTISRRLIAFLLLLALAAAPALAKKGKDKKRVMDPEELFNPLLGVDYSHWLVGAIFHIASEEEVEAYLRLKSDEEAVSFIEEFWQSRNKGTDLFAKSPQQIYESRVAEADRRFSEGAYPGSRSDRGAIFIVYGEPEEITFSTPNRVDDPTLEVFRYSKDAPLGLNGKAPEKEYRFIRVDGRTVAFRGGHRRRPETPAERLRRRSRIPPGLSVVSDAPHHGDAQGR